MNLFTYRLLGPTRWLVLTSLLVLGGTVAAQTLTCSTSPLLSRVVSLSGSTIGSYDLSANTYTELGPLTLVEYNALGYNLQDGYLYAFNSTTSELYRIDNLGQYTSLGVPSGLPTGQYFAGTVDSDGAMWAYTRSSKGRLVRIEGLTSGTPTVVASVQVTYGGAADPAVADIALNPADGLLYGYDNERGAVAQIDPQTGVATLLPPTSPQLTRVAGAWFNGDGLFYTFRRDTGELHAIDLSSSTAWSIGSVSPANEGDATSCPYAVGFTLAASETDLTRGQTVTLTFALQNPANDPLTDVSLDLTLPGGLTYVGATLATGVFGGTANAYAGTGTLALTGLTLPAQTTATITVDVKVPLNEPFASYDLQATLGNLPALLGGTLASDNPATAPLGDPTPLNVTFPAPNSITCSVDPLLALVGPGTQTTLVQRMDGSPTFNLTALGVAPLVYNAIGYNVTDGYVYGLNADTRVLYRIDALGQATSLGVPNGMPTGLYYAATMGPDGTFYAYTRNTKGQLVVIDGLSDGLPMVVATYTVSGSPNVADIAYNPADGLLYGNDNLGSRLLTIDPTSGAVAEVVTTDPALGYVAGVWFDAMGGFYGYSRKTGDLYSIDLGTGVATTVLTTTGAAEGDAASCPFNGAPPAQTRAARPHAAPDADVLPADYRVEAIYPNPFNPTAQVRFAVPQSQRVTVTVFDVLGREVARPFAGPVEAHALQTVTLDGSDLASGLYLVRIEGPSFKVTQRATLLK